MRQVLQIAMKKIGFRVFCGWSHKLDSSLAILAQVTWAQPQEGSISLKYLLETWLESQSFEPLIGFLAFLVQKLWPKNNRSII